MGLKPGNPDGTFVQDVPLVGFQAKQVDRGVLRPAADRFGLSFPDDFVAVSRRMAEKSRSTTPTSSSSATAWSPPSTAGTTTRGWTCAARR